jgi:penicillin G amidase
MLSLALALLQTGPIVVRDDYGVPMVRAAGWDDAFRGLGRAVAEDRLWQMETSRRTASGRMAEIVGPAGLPADQETRQSGYTQAELQGMFDALPDNARAAFTAYAEGVNDTIRARTQAGTLPKGYAESGLAPEPWSVLDSCAIGVMMGRLFGTGGAGELRNLALATYLQSQPCKPRFLDVFDDLGWLWR